MGANFTRSGFWTVGTVLERSTGKGEATRERILEIAEAAVLAKGFGATSIDEVIAAVYPPRESIDLDDLAEMISCVVDGAIIMSKTLNDPKRLDRQILLFRSCTKLVFAPPPSS